MMQPSTRVIFPLPPERYDRAWIARLLEVLASNLERRLSKETANDSILLRSPGGKVYSITVSDTGALTSTYIQG